MRLTWKMAIEEATYCGFSRAVLLPAQIVQGYMPNDASLRSGITANPQDILPGAKSVLVAAMPFTWFSQWPRGYAEVSAYYFASQQAHQAIKTLADRLTSLGATIGSAQRLPLKLLGQSAGFGIQGKNTLLRNDLWGSCFTLRMLATDIPPQENWDTMPASPCGECNRCVTACPTCALGNGYTLDVNRCIRNHMLSGQPAPLSVREHMGVRLLGCEDCQRVCPANNVISAKPPPAYPFSIETLLQPDKAALEAIATTLGKNEARKQRIRAQAAIAAGHDGNTAYLPPLRAFSQEESPAAAEHAAWAIEQIQKRSENSHVEAGKS